MKYVLLLGGGAIVLAAATYVLLFGPDSTTPATTGTEPAETAAETETVTREPFAGQGTLADLIARAESVECTITYTPSDMAPVSGTYFVHDGQIRGDFITTVPELGGEVVSSIIMSDNTMYTWSDIAGQQYGMMMTLDSTTSVETDGSSQEPIPRDVPVDYECRPWVAIDNSIFEPPATVLFNDMSAIMEAGMEYGTIYSEGEVLLNQ